MDSELVGGLWARGSSRRGLALTLLGILAVLSLTIAPPARAHEPYMAKAWGNNEAGQLGNGTTTGPEQCGAERAACSTTSVAVTGLSGVSAVAGGPTVFNQFSLALLEDGTVSAWGANSEGQLGNGTRQGSDVPVAVKELSGVTAISAGEAHGLALLSDGTVKAWGKNASGQLGNGTATSSNLPVAICAVGEEAPCVKDLNEVAAISAGGQHGLALLKNGTVMAWGENLQGQLGNGTTTGRTVPAAVCAPGEKAPCAQDLSRVVAISAGYRHSLALLSDGTVVAWGNNGSGRLGNGTTTNSDIPVAVTGLTEVAAISAGGASSLAVLKNGAVRAWGANAEGQLGDGTSSGPESCGPVPPQPCSKTPVAVSGLSEVSTVSAGGSHSLALLKGGTVTAWGANDFGQLGDGTSSGPEPCGPGFCSTTPVVVSKLFDVKGMGAGGSHSLAFGPPPPTVTSISPKEGPRSGGTKVTITGTELEEGEVKFGTAKATGVTVSSNGAILEALSPPGSGTVDVTVTTPAGTSPTSTADKFSYPQAPPEAHLPEIGRCVKATKGKGEWMGFYCNTEAEGKGNYNWFSGPVASKFTSTLKGTAIKSSGKNAVTITCASGASEGEYTGAKSLKVTKLVLSGCKQSPAKSALEADCQNVGVSNGVIEGKELGGSLVFLQEGSKPKVGWVLTPAVGSAIARFECGGANELTGKGSGTGTVRELNGSLANRIVKLNSMQIENTAIYEPAFESLTMRVGTEGEFTTLTGTEAVKNLERLEVRDKICNTSKVCMT